MLLEADIFAGDLRLLFFVSWRWRFGGEGAGLADRAEWFGFEASGFGDCDWGSDGGWLDLDCPIKFLVEFLKRGWPAIDDGAHGPSFRGLLRAFYPL